MDEEQWLYEEDSKSRPFRAERLRELLEIFPIPESGMLTFGGFETATALTEVRLAYVDGLYLSVILLSLAVLERHFAGMLYSKGLESAKRMKVEDLLKRAKKEGVLGPDEEADFEQLRQLRNSYAHFRDSLHEFSSLQRSIKEDL